MQRLFLFKAINAWIGDYEYNSTYNTKVWSAVRLVQKCTKGGRASRIILWYRINYRTVGVFWLNRLQPTGSLLHVPWDLHCALDVFVYLELPYLQMVATAHVEINQWIIRNGSSVFPPSCSIGQVFLWMNKLTYQCYWYSGWSISALIGELRTRMQPQMNRLYYIRFTDCFCCFLWLRCRDVNKFGFKKIG